MSEETFPLSHKQFTKLAPEAFRNLIHDEYFTDVTLATRDNKQIKAHKVILASSSNFFENILIHNPRPNPLIYLKDISFDNLVLILNFIYLGLCEVPVDFVDDFIAVGKEVQVEGLLEPVEDNSTYEQKHQVPTDEIFRGRNDLEQSERSSGDKTETLKSDKDFGINELMESTVLQHDMISKNIIDNGKYTCDRCKYQTIRKSDLKRHILSIHDLVKYDCDKCDYKAGYRSDLRKHNKSIHDRIQYTCDQCPFISSMKTKLKIHRRMQHTQDQ